MTEIRIGVAADFLDAAGGLRLRPEGRQRLEARAGVELIPLRGRPMGHAIERADLEGFDILMIKRNPIAAETLEGVRPRVRLLARMGVGYDHLDVPALTRAGILLAITPGAVRRPVASGIMALILALAHRVRERDRDARRLAWDERFARQGVGLEGRTLGLLGLGNIGTELLRLIAPFGMHHLVHDPWARPARAAALDARLGGLDEVVAEADFLVLALPFSEATRRLIDEGQLRRMKPSAYVVNLARGEIVEEAALVRALREGWIAGAGIDVFETEPPAADNPLLGLENVVLSLHNLCYTDEFDRLAHAGVVDNILAWIEGRVPEHAVNPEARHNQSGS